MQYRELTPEEFERAPREVAGSELFTPKNSRILGAFNEYGEIVAEWVFFYAPHCEPFWIREDYRKNPSVVKNMAVGMRRLLDQSGVKEAYTVVLDAVHARVMTRLAVWFGFIPVPGTLFKWNGKADINVD